MRETEMDGAREVGGCDGEYNADAMNRSYTAGEI